MKSMTGFGRATYRDDKAEIFIEIKTVNHRYRDFFLKIPRILNPVEDRIKAVISEKITRGRIELFIKYNELNAEHKQLVYNEALAKEYMSVLKRMKKLDITIDDSIDLSLVSKFPDIITVEDAYEDYDAVYKRLEPLLTDAVNQVIDSRQREGDALKADILKRTGIIKASVAAIEAKSPDMIRDYEAGLREKITHLTETVEIDEQRLLTEVAIMADKLTIDEEITRLNCHMDRLAEMCNDDEAVGRKLDFLVQELNREINTIGSKATDIEISNRVVDIKGDVEKIREQVQNIE